MKFILASGSPQRKELLKLVIPEFEIKVSGVEEKLEEGLTVPEQVTRLAYIKAKDIYEKTEGNRIIIGSDTVVTKNGKIYGKPKNREQAKQMLIELQEGDKTHSIMTGLCIIISENGKYKEYKTFDEVKIYLKNMSDNEMEKWLDTGKAMNKAGAYGIQNEFCVFIDKIEGNYDTAVGLSTHKIYDIIKEYI